MKDYLSERSMLFNAWSAFSCPDSCERMGCKAPDEPGSISPQREATLQQLWEMSAREAFLSDFYLFGLSPFVIDLKSVAGEGLGGIPISENGKARLPHHRIEELISHRFREGGYLWDWEAKIEELDRVDGPEGLVRMKLWTDRMAMVTDRSSLNIIHQFDGNRLLPIRPRK
jgi:hypothetical protein